MKTLGHELEHDFDFMNWYHPGVLSFIKLVEVSIRLNGSLSQRPFFCVSWQNKKS
jgi:hypothetical protein